jgi:putative PLP-dependent aminotransferase (TIGR04422 family)
MVFDYQWPIVRSLPVYSDIQNQQGCLAAYAEIEATFTRRFGTTAVLLPSGRSSLAAILEFSQLSRQHLVFAPQWSSHCVWDVIGRVANPTTSLASTVDAIIAVHKWGYPFKLEVNKNTLIIEDSVDSIIKDSSALFPLRGEFEIFSLPKIIGSYSGAIVLTSNDNFISYVHQTRLANIALATHQSQLKYKKYSGHLLAHESPEALESLNRGLTTTDLQHIQNCLPSYDLNLATIVRRIAKLNQHFGVELIAPHTSRLPCVYPLKTAHFATHSPALFLQRQFNWSLSLNTDLFEPCWLLPLHFDVPEEHFDAMLQSVSIKKNIEIID